MFFYIHLKNLKLNQYLFEYHEIEIELKIYPIKEPVKNCKIIYFK